MAVLTPEQVAQYHDLGYVFLPGFAPEGVVALKDRMTQLVAQYEVGERLVAFETVSNSQGKAEEFLASGDKIRFFLEDEALRDGRLLHPKDLSINKCGHALHTDDDVFRAFSGDPRLGELARQLGIASPTVVQSMYIFKSPLIGGEVRAHQDDTFVTTSGGSSCLGLWFALDDASAANGCLWVAPRSHSKGITRRFVLNAERTECHFEPAGAPEIPDIPPEDYVCIEAKRGDCLLLHGSTVHKSDRNTSGTPRNAYTLHIVDGSTPMSPDCWLQRGHARLPLPS